MWTVGFFLLYRLIEYRATPGFLFLHLLFFLFSQHLQLIVRFIMFSFINFVLNDYTGLCIRARFCFILTVQSAAKILLQWWSPNVQEPPRVRQREPNRKLFYMSARFTPRVRKKETWISSAIKGKDDCFAPPVLSL